MFHIGEKVLAIYNDSNLAYERGQALTVKSFQSTARGYTILTFEEIEGEHRSGDFCGEKTGTGKSLAASYQRKLANREKQKQNPRALPAG